MTPGPNATALDAGRAHSVSWRHRPRASEFLRCAVRLGMVPHKPRRGDLFIVRELEKISKPQRGGMGRSEQSHAAPLGLGRIGGGKTVAINRSLLRSLRRCVGLKLDRKGAAGGPTALLQWMRRLRLGHAWRVGGGAPLTSIVRPERFYRGYACVLFRCHADTGPVESRGS
jgi:hypothetical protein